MPVQRWILAYAAIIELLRDEIPDDEDGLAPDPLDGGGCSPVLPSQLVVAPSSSAAAGRESGGHSLLANCGGFPLGRTSSVVMHPACLITPCPSRDRRPNCTWHKPLLLLLLRWRRGLPLCISTRTHCEPFSCWTFAKHTQFQCSSFGVLCWRRHWLFSTDSLAAGADGGLRVSRHDLLDLFTPRSDSPSSPATGRPRTARDASASSLPDVCEQAAEAPSFGGGGGGGGGEGKDEGVQVAKQENANAVPVQQAADSSL